MDMLELAQEKVDIGGKTGMPVVIEHIDKEGNVERMSLGV